MDRNIVISAPLPPTAINEGVISACGVRRHFNFPEGCNSVEFEVRDERGVGYDLKAKRRMSGNYPKETITGLKSYIQAKDLGVGDRINIHNEREVKVLGVVFRPQFYSIHFEKVAQAGGNIAGGEAGEN